MPSGNYKQIPTSTRPEVERFVPEWALQRLKILRTVEDNDSKSAEKLSAYAPERDMESIANENKNDNVDENENKNEKKIEDEDYEDESLSEYEVEIESVSSSDHAEEEIFPEVSKTPSSQSSYEEVSCSTNGTTGGTHLFMSTPPTKSLTKSPSVASSGGSSNMMSNSTSDSNTSSDSSSSESSSSESDSDSSSDSDDSDDSDSDNSDSNSSSSDNDSSNCINSNTSGWSTSSEATTEPSETAQSLEMVSETNRGGGKFDTIFESESSIDEEIFESMRTTKVIHSSKTKEPDQVRVPSLEMNSGSDSNNKSNNNTNKLSIMSYPSGSMDEEGSQDMKSELESNKQGLSSTLRSSTSSMSPTNLPQTLPQNMEEMGSSIQHLLLPELKKAPPKHRRKIMPPKRETKAASKTVVTQALPSKEQEALPREEEGKQKEHRDTIVYDNGDSSSVTQSLASFWGNPVRFAPQHRQIEQTETTDDDLYTEDAITSEAEPLRNRQVYKHRWVFGTETETLLPDPPAALDGSNLGRDTGFGGISTPERNPERKRRNSQTTNSRSTDDYSDWMPPSFNKNHADRDAGDGSMRLLATTVAETMERLSKLQISPPTTKIKKGVRRVDDSRVQPIDPPNPSFEGTRKTSSRRINFAGETTVIPSTNKQVRKYYQDPKNANDKMRFLYIPTSTPVISGDEENLFDWVPKETRSQTSVEHEIDPTYDEVVSSVEREIDPTDDEVVYISDEINTSGDISYDAEVIEDSDNADGDGNDVEANRFSLLDNNESEDISTSSRGSDIFVYESSNSEYDALNESESFEEVSIDEEEENENSKRDFGMAKANGDIEGTRTRASKSSRSSRQLPQRARNPNPKSKLATKPTPKPIIQPNSKAKPRPTVQQKPIKTQRQTQRQTSAPTPTRAKVEIDAGQHAAKRQTPTPTPTSTPTSAMMEIDTGQHPEKPAHCLDFTFCILLVIIPGLPAALLFGIRAILAE